jgi:hypothetical protein
MKKILWLNIILMIICIDSNYAQIKRYGKVNKTDFVQTKNPDFKDANAIVLFKERRSYFDYDGEKGWTLITEIHERIKLNNKEGFSYGTKSIKLYNNKGNANERVSIKAITFNLEGEKVVKTKLSKKDIFEERMNRYWSRKKFTMPNLKEGSIVEWSYKISSPFYTNIGDIVYQYDIPVKYVDEQILIPEYFVVNPIVSKYFMINVKEEQFSRTISYTYTSSTVEAGGEVPKYSSEVEFMENSYEVKLNNVKPLVKEPFVNNINNYRGKVSFELVSTRMPNRPFNNYSTSWDAVVNHVRLSNNFGEQLKAKNYFKEDLNAMIAGVTSPNEKLIKVFSFVKNKIKWNGFNGVFTRDGVKKAYKEGVGNVAEVNLTLVAMLREAGLKAEPVLVSTRSHGMSLTPTIDGFNYVIAAVENPNGIYFLDATEKYSLPNVLPLRALNWQGRIVRRDGTSTFINLFPNTFNSDVKNVNIKINEEGELTGTVRSIYNNLNALNYRTYFNNLAEDDLIKNNESKYDNIEIEKIRVNNKNNIGKPVVESFKFNADNQTEVINDKIYFSPLFFLQRKENIFKSKERQYPIDFGAAWLDKYDIVISIPEGYKVEKLTESANVEIEGNLGSFTYKISQHDNVIRLGVVTKINMAIIPSNQYLQVKEFYKKMINIQSGKIVLSKK